MQFTAYLKDGTALTIPNSQNRSQSQVQQQLIDLYGEHFDRIEQVITPTPPPTVKRVRRVEPITDELYHWITKIHCGIKTTQAGLTTAPFGVILYL